METAELRRRILDLFDRDSSNDWVSIRNKLQESIKADLGQELSREDLKLADQILWDLVVERLVTFGSRSGNAAAHFPFVRLTDLGHQVVMGSQPHRFDPEKYVEFLATLTGQLQDTIRQYALEALRAFRQNLLFATAVMIGAAAEAEMLLLLESIRDWEQDPRRKKLLTEALERGRLPPIFEQVREAVNRAEAQYGMPYSVHQGVTPHLLSLQEMIRVQRNDAVHPAAAAVTRAKVFLSLQTFPAAFEVAERLRSWFKSSATS